MAKSLTQKKAEGVRIRKDRLNPNEPEPTEPVGEPIISLTNRERALYDEIVALSHEGTTYRPDTVIVAMAAKLLCRIEQDDEATMSCYGQLMQCLARLGMTPSDRRKLAQMDKPKEAADGFEEF